MADQNASTKLDPLFPYAGRSTTAAKIDRQFQKVADMKAQGGTPSNPTRSIEETVDDVVNDPRFTSAVKSAATVDVTTLDFTKLTDAQVKDLKAKLGI